MQIKPTCDQSSSRIILVFLETEEAQFVTLLIVLTSN